jgi:type II secretory pathway pseudopilin PulG
LSAARRSWELRGDLAALLFFFVFSEVPGNSMRARYPTAAVAIHRAGVTLVETVIAVSLMTFAASALLTTVCSSVQISTTSQHTVIATGLADQLMDEIASVSFPGSGSASTGSGRTGFTNFDAYNGYSASPPLARSGQVIGTEDTAATTRPQQFQPDPKLLSHFTQQVLVEKIADSGGSTWVTASQSTTLRRVTVTISYTDANGVTTPLAVQVRVFTNVAVAP